MRKRYIFIFNKAAVIYNTLGSLIYGGAIDVMCKHSIIDSMKKIKKLVISL